MPELPEVETVRRGLEPVLLGQRIIQVEQRRKDLRIPFPADFAARLERRTIHALRRRAKYLLVDLDDDSVVIWHLGMSGSVRVEPPGSNRVPGRHDHVCLSMANGHRILFNDPRRFGLMTLTMRNEESTHPLLAALAADPLDPLFTPTCLEKRLRQRRTPIKNALLDQRTVGGVGNIYASEALFRAGISPRRLACNLTASAHDKLVHALVTVLQEAVDAGGSSLRDHRLTSGELGYFQHRFQVYNREGENCAREGCAGIVRRIVQGGRSTFMCGGCQR